MNPIHDKLKKPALEADVVPAKGEITTDIAIWKETTVTTCQQVVVQTAKNGAAIPDLLVDADSEEAALEQRLAKASERQAKE